MFNGELKKEAIEKLNSSVDSYERLRKKIQASSAELFVLRKSSSENIIKNVESYINALSNSPKEFDKSFSEYKAEFKAFTQILDDLSKKSDAVNVDFGTTATAGVLAGVGTAAFTPTAAMAIATTFGTASTGTAIASLSGVAATNAAVAWLGGGALAAGGGGIAAGEALLALAGPIGWAIGGAALVGGGLLARSKNEKIANEANSKRREVEVLIAQLRSANREIKSLLSLTKDHCVGVEGILKKLKNNAPKNYHDFSLEDKDNLGSLINHINSLSQLLNKRLAV